MAENLNETQAQGQTETTETEKTSYTKEEVEKLLQAETDRRVTSALKKQEAKNAEKLREAQKLASMNEEQKYAYELEQREAKIAEKEKQLALAEMTNTASKILNEKGLSLELVRFVVNEDGDTTNENIKTLERAFKASVKAEVEKRLGSSSPKKNLMDEGSMTVEQFRKLSLVQQAQLARDNPTLYQTLTKRG